MRLVFQYAVLHAVPRVERGERINVGVVLYCQQAEFLQAAVHVDDARLRGLDPAADVEMVRDALSALQRTCTGEGPAAGSTLGQRFRWLTAPRSTVIQASAAHSGFTADPQVELERLLKALVH